MSRKKSTYAHCLDEYLVEACCFTEDDGLASLTCHASKTACRRARTDEGVGVYGKFLHSRLVAKYATFRAFTARVDGEDGKTAAVFLKDMNAKLVDACGLSRTGNT